MPWVNETMCVGQEAFLERIIRRFNMQKKVAQLTIDKLNDFKHYENKG